MREPVAIVFFPEGSGVPEPVLDWQARNPTWRVVLDDVITCPVCGIPVRAIADVALLDEAGVRREIQRYRDDYLRAACSDHAWPAQEYWAVLESRIR